MPAVKLSSKNQMVLPREAREAMRVKSGDELLVVVKGNTAVILPMPESHTRALAGRGKGLYSKDYLKKERRSW